MRQWMMAGGVAVLIAVGSARADERVDGAAVPVDGAAAQLDAKMAGEAKSGRGEEAAQHRMADYSTGAAKQRDAEAGRKVEKKRAPQEDSPFEWNQASGG